MPTNNELAAIAGLAAVAAASKSDFFKKSDHFMLWPDIAFNKDPKDNYSIVLPVIKSERHQVAAEVSQYPIEYESKPTETTMSDSIIRTPRTLELNTHVTDDSGSGIVEKAIRKFITPSEVGEEPLSKIIFTRLRNWCEKGIILRVSGAFIEMGRTNFVINNVSADKGAREGLDISISLREVVFTNSEKYKTIAEEQKAAPEVPKSKKKPTSKVDNGKIENKAVENNKSVLASIFGL